MGGFPIRLAPWHWDARARQRALVIVLALAFVAALGWRQAGGADARPPYQVPTSADMENKLGVRFVQAAVVADGGLVELRYVVLDTQKATRFQSDTKHPPFLKSERRNGTAWRAALMRQGHQLQPGQSYFLLYLNNHNAIRSGETLEIDAGDKRLVNVPVR
jgi:hypothetical protein